jgi:cobalt-zinc-cadmium resistance protein CzcA
VLFEKGIKPVGIKATTVIILLSVTAVNESKAQTSISLRAAIDTALKNNLALRNDKLQAEYLKKMQGAGADIPQTLVTGEYGQINSYYHDTRFGITQNIKFPTVYNRQKSVLAHEWKNGLLNVTVKQNELKRKVTAVFYELLYLDQKQALLQHADSIYAKFLENAELRFSKGESDILERTTAQAQRGQVSQQLKQLEQDKAIVQLQFLYLLCTPTQLIPAKENQKLGYSSAPDTLALRQHPVMAQLKQQQELSMARYRLERSRLMPDLFLGYYNMSMRGVGADEHLYNYSTRFQSVQAGIGLPLFFGAQRSKINALKVGQLIAENNYHSGLNALQSQYQQAYLEYQKNQQAINYYENVALKNAETIIVTANKQFSSGAISYLEWALLINQSVNIQNEYIEILKAYNQSIIQLNSFTSNQ